MMKEKIFTKEVKIDLNKKMGNDIRKLRITNKWNKQDLCNELHIDTSTLMRYEKGVSTIPAVILKKIAEKANCNVYWLLGFKDEKPDKNEILTNIIKANEDLLEVTKNTSKELFVASYSFHCMHWTDSLLSYKLQKYLSENRTDEKNCEKLKKIIQARIKIIREKSKPFYIYEMLPLASTIKFFKNKQEGFDYDKKHELLDYIESDIKERSGSLKIRFSNIEIPINVEVMDGKYLKINYFFQYKQVMPEPLYLSFVSPNVVQNIYLSLKDLFDQHSTEFEEHIPRLRKCIKI